MRNFFRRSVESVEKDSSINQGELIEESGLPQSVKDEVEKIMVKYNSASNNGLFRIKDYRKIDIGDGKTRYLVEGSLSIHAPSSISGNNYVGNDHMQFIIEVRGDEVLKVEKKLEEEMEIAA